MKTLITFIPKNSPTERMWAYLTKREIELWPEAIRWWSSNSHDDPPAEILALIEKYPDLFVEGKTVKDIIIAKFANDYILSKKTYKNIPPVLHKEVLDYIRSKHYQVIFNKSINYWQGITQMSDLDPFERILIPECVENSSYFEFGKERGKFQWWKILN